MASTIANDLKIDIKHQIDKQVIYSIFIRKCLSLVHSVWNLCGYFRDFLTVILRNGFTKYMYMCRNTGDKQSFILGSKFSERFWSV